MRITGLWGKTVHQALSERERAAPSLNPAQGCAGTFRLCYGNITNLGLK